MTAIETLENRLLFAFGEPDLSFGVAGKATAPGEDVGIIEGRQLLVMPNGNILLSGTRGLSRLSANGAVDKSFGTSGTTSLPAGLEFVASAIDPSSHKIAVLVNDASNGTQVIRYTNAGKLDTTFGSGGVAQIANFYDFIPQALAIQPDGKVIVAGAAGFDVDFSFVTDLLVYRVKSNGAPDTTFGSAGHVEFAYRSGEPKTPETRDNVASVNILPGGKIDIVGGSKEYRPPDIDSETGDVYDEGAFGNDAFAVAQLTSAGALNSSYGSAGITLEIYTTEENNSSLPSAAVVRADGSVLVGALAGSMTIAEFDPAGKLKYLSRAGFGTDFGVMALTLLKDGRAVALCDNFGRGDPGPPKKLLAITTDGTFSNIVLTASNSIDGECGLATASDGNLLFTGSTSGYVVEKYQVGSANDPRPDNFANGQANDIALDRSGGLHLAYYDAATTHLVYAHRKPDGLWEKSVVVDSANLAGQYVSIDANSADHPSIAYFDGAHGDLKLAQFDGTKWTIETVDQHGSTGLYPSFDYDSADEPVVIYYNKGKHKLVFAVKKSSTRWRYETVDQSGDDVGRSNALTISTKTNRYALAYLDNTTGSVMWAGQRKGGGWDVKTAAKTQGGARDISLAYGQDQVPMISFYDVTRHNLRISEYSNADFQAKTLAATPDQGQYSFAFGDTITARGHVLAYNRSRDKITQFDDAFGAYDGFKPTTTDIVTTGGRYFSVATQPDFDFANESETVLAYYDTADKVLKIRPGPRF